MKWIVKVIRDCGSCDYSGEFLSRREAAAYARDCRKMPDAESVTIEPGGLT